VTSIDTNILMFAFNEDSPLHARAFSFVKSLSENRDVILSELSLVELYRLVRNPVVVSSPLNPAEAVEVVAKYRFHPHWTVVGFPGIASQMIHEKLWALAASPGFAYRRIYDARLALSLQHFGVTDFATANVKDFEGLGFRRVWNPLSE
jgi:toxin-antitoxin system PIN domain toxin